MDNETIKRARQAVQTLDKVAALAGVIRQDHINTQEAANFLLAVLDDEEKAKIAPPLPGPANVISLPAQK